MTILYNAFLSHFFQCRNSFQISSHLPRLPTQYSCSLPPSLPLSITTPVSGNYLWYGTFCMVDTLQVIALKKPDSAIPRSEHIPISFQRMVGSCIHLTPQTHGRIIPGGVYIHLCICPVISRKHYFLQIIHHIIFPSLLMWRTLILQRLV